MKRFFYRLFMWYKRYDHGWIDGWNACRSTDPDKRIYMTEHALLARFKQDD